MDLFDAIAHRRSVRAFIDSPVSRHLITQMIDAATQAPSAVNRQPWHFTVVEKRALLKEISDHSKRHMLAQIDGGKGPKEFREHLLDPNFDIFYGAPALILISGSTSDDWIAEDAALAAQNLMLAAYGLGLGTCWIGFAQRWLETEDGRRLLDVPFDKRPVAPLIVGHPSGTASAVPRHPPTIHWIE